MEVVDIPSEFKVKWLNETLKFIKNDQLLVYKYPEWPISRVKYYHALIAQRQYKIGLGFKSLYAPLWEAMQIFGLKYTFKVTIMNFKEGEKGRLVLEKIPKDSAQQDETDSDDDSTCRHQLTKQSEKLYIQNRAIIDKVSPIFLKTTLQSLLDFIKDEASASIVFEDLAPIEAKFIENVQAVHDHKHLFYKIFSPACIDILKKITSSLNMYKNSFNLRIGNIKTHMKTAKREVTIVKEPNFGNPPPKKQNKPQGNPPAKPLRSPKGVESLKTSNKPETEISKRNGELSSAITKPIIAKEIVSSLQNNSPEKEIRVDSPTSGELNRIQSSCRKDNEKTPTDVKVVTEKKPILATKNESQKAKVVISTPICNLQKKEEKIYVTSASEKDRKVTTPKKVTVTVQKSPVKSKRPLTRAEKNKAMIEAMSKPLESDKGMRMMKLMGWEGGALGLRGDGITEPLMPALHLKPGYGLGASSVEPKKQNKNPDLRIQFLEGVLEVLSRGMKILHFDAPLCKKEAKFFTTALDHFNRRLKVSLPSDRERTLVEDILHKLKKDPEKKINLSFMNGASALRLQFKLIKKENAPQMMEVSDSVAFKDVFTELEQSENLGPKALHRLALKIYILKMVLDYVKSDGKIMDLMFETAEVCKKKYKYMMAVFDSVNTNTYTRTANETEIMKEISMHLNETCITVDINNKILTFRKTDRLEANVTKEQQQTKANKKSKKVKLKDDDNNNVGNMKKTELVKESQVNIIVLSNNTSLEITIENKLQGLSLNADRNKVSSNENVIVTKNQNITVSRDLFNDNNKNKTLKTQENLEQDLFNDNNKNKTLKTQENLEHNDNKNNLSNLNNIDIKLKKTENEFSASKARPEVIKFMKPDIAAVKDLTGDSNIDVPKENLQSKDYNDNIIYVDKSATHVKSDICDKDSDKNNKDLSKNAQIFIIKVIEYKEHNIIKIVLHDTDMLARISSSIQGHLINDDNYSKNKYIKCHGIQNGGLIYSSDGDWFKNILCRNFKIQCTNGTIDKLKMKVHLNSFLTVKDILHALQVNNDGLKTNDWIVLEEGDCYFTVSLDCDSFKFICKKRFSLFAGIDTALFTVVL